MRTDPLTRKRVGSQPVILADLSAAHGAVGIQPAQNVPTTQTVTGANSRIFAGLFGTANPRTNSSAEVAVPGRKALYHYHEGDLFTPGTENYVFDYPFEFPLQTIWGRAFMRKPNTFDPFQPPQVQSNANILINGIGGLVAGQFAMQPLETEGE